MSKTYFFLKHKRVLSVNGLFINDVTQVGEAGSNFCDSKYEDLSKTSYLDWPRGGGSENAQFRVTSLLNDP